MKHLKLFEELNYENSKLTEDEFYDEVGDELELVDFDNFSNVEFEKIRSFIQQINPKWSCEFRPSPHLNYQSKTTLNLMLNCEWIKTGNSYGHRITGGPAIDIKIMKGKDSWYYITKTIFKEKRGFMDEIITYYKCDQLEGLLETLKDIT